MNLTVQILVALASVLVPALGIGYWCYRIWRRKGRSGRTGFLVGFVPSFLLTPIVGIAAVPISYGLSDLHPGPDPRRDEKLIAGIVVAIVLIVGLSLLTQRVLGHG